MPPRSSGKDGARAIRASEFRRLIHDQLQDGATGESDRMEIVFNLMRLVSRLTQDFESLHRRRGWTWAGFRIMNVLSVVEIIEPRELARLSGASRASISSALNTLERDGLVARSRTSSDRRLVQVQLTHRGRQELRAAVQAQAERERAWFERLGEGDRRTLIRLLGLLADQPKPK